MQRRQLLFEHRPAAGIEFLPKLTRNADDVFKFVRARYRDIVGIVKRQNRAFDRDIDFDFASQYVFDSFDFGLGKKGQEGEGGK